MAQLCDGSSFAEERATLEGGQPARQLAPQIQNGEQYRDLTWATGRVWGIR